MVLNTTIYDGSYHMYEAHYPYDVDWSRMIQLDMIGDVARGCALQVLLNMLLAGPLMNSDIYEQAHKPPTNIVGVI